MWQFLTSRGDHQCFHSMEIKILLPSVICEMSVSIFPHQVSRCPVLQTRGAHLVNKPAAFPHAVRDTHESCCNRAYLFLWPGALFCLSPGLTTDSRKPTGERCHCHSKKNPGIKTKRQLKASLLFWAATLGPEGKVSTPPGLLVLCAPGSHTNSECDQVWSLHSSFLVQFKTKSYI